MNKETFDISTFTEYKHCPQQYTRTFIRSAKAVKIKETETSIDIAIAESMMNETGSYLKSFHGTKTVQCVSVPETAFSEFIGNILEVDSSELNSSAFSLSHKTSDKFLLDSISDSSPITNIINSIFLQAIRRNVSDIHIQPLDTDIHIRFRLDGVLHTVQRLPKSIAGSIVQRIKIMAHLDITEQRQPQDGRMDVTIQTERSAESHSLRVSIVPVKHGESIVLRFFNIQTSAMTLEHLGFYPEEFALLQQASKIPNGLILATGPTGSGKTTTLHALIQMMNTETQNIITIEDPIERVLPNVNQIQVDYGINITFDNMLRRVLRQDPNVIMVGEIRDTETAELALRAALTGHVIFSTLHTNDSISAISRLSNMGIEHFLIASVLRYVIAQRLVRTLCSHCKIKKTVPDFFRSLQKKYNITSNCIYEKNGCEHCSFTGYAGRTVIAELFIINNDLEKMISEQKSAAKINSYTQHNGMKTLEFCAVRKASDGITSIEEILREGLLCSIKNL